MAEKKQHEPDNALDAVLAKYATVEPRAGLEDRILANLRSGQARVSDGAWWGWGLAGGSAAIVIVTVALVLGLKSGKQSHPITTNPSSMTTQALKKPATQVASNRRGDDSRPQTSGAVRNMTARRAQPMVVADNLNLDQPKLDQFPSPRPLSEQEKLALDYVRQFPKEAALMARAQTTSAQQEELEKSLPPSTEWPDREKQE